MEHIILIGHGSPKKDANNIELVGKLLHRTIHPECGKQCVRVAYLQFAEPDIMDTIRACVDDGASKIIVHPYFLSSGMHVTKDIPETIQEAGRAYPHVEFTYTDPLGIHEKLVQVVLERINAATFKVPEDIERRSFEIISEELDLSDVPPEQIPIMKRVIHSTADFEFKKTLVFHPEAIRTGIDAIRAGKDILTDIEMVKAGITKRLLQRSGSKVICNINDKEVVAISGETGRTRAEIAMEKGITESIGIIAIGNAPTALLKVIELLSDPGFHKGVSQYAPTHDASRITHHGPLVVGVPVGFVKALESKALLATQNFPFITNLSQKGGTPVAVAIVNALLRMAREGGD